MSYGLYGYVVSLDDLRAVIGSKKKSAIASLTRGRAADFREIDDMDDTGKLPTMREAIEDLIMGRAPNRRAWYVYTYAVMEIVTKIGRRAGTHYHVFPNWFESTSASWLGDFHAALEDAEIEDVFMELYSSPWKHESVPVRFANKDWPYAALILHDRCERALASFTNGLGKLAPDFVPAALQQHAWLAEVQGDEALALFYF